MPAGTVKFYNSEKGFGFISKDDGSAKYSSTFRTAPRRSKRLIPLKHRNHEQGASAANIRKLPELRKTFDVSGIGPNVRDMHEALCHSHATNGCFGREENELIRLSAGGKRWRDVVQRDWTEPITFSQPQTAELSFAKPGRIHQH